MNGMGFYKTALGPQFLLSSQVYGEAGPRRQHRSCTGQPGLERASEPNPHAVPLLPTQLPERVWVSSTRLASFPLSYGKRDVTGRRERVI